MRTAGQT
jgi:hypothetical protein